MSATAATLIKTIWTLKDSLARVNVVASPRAYDLLAEELEATKRALVAHLARPISPSEIRTIEIDGVTISLYTVGTGQTTVSVRKGIRATGEGRTHNWTFKAERHFAEVVLSHARI